ncbi:TaqI-like C-terminal specificity domain-containing protein [Flectobacillus roseus]|uniref:site-specific DNA-methyltransferase (adenine-specific) n=1 Tax=Flectobacillus roseus TaxID=502259 RepID=A0ABT6Y6Y4_9BACT|nr:TaqI-like C-terminal specificity domain-containing protein [Flectobacillus roseus]
MLRGRDIKRYGYEFADLWLIHTHNGLKEKGLERIKIEDYPAIKKHLDSYYFELEKRADKGDTIYNLRNCAYMDDFSKPKIVWAETMRIHKNSNERFPRFAFEDTEHYYTDKTCFFAVGKNIKFLVAYLNSKVGKYLCSQYVSILDDGGYLMQKKYLQEIPIPQIDGFVINKIELLFSQVLDKKINNIVSSKAETEIDNTIYQLFNFDYSEIQFVDFQ